MVGIIGFREGVSMEGSDEGIVWQVEEVGKSNTGIKLKEQLENSFINFETQELQNNVACLIENVNTVLTHLPPLSIHTLTHARLLETTISPLV